MWSNSNNNINNDNVICNDNNDNEMTNVYINIVLMKI